MQKKYNRSKKIKSKNYKKGEKMEQKVKRNKQTKKENSTELQRPNVDAEVYNKNKKCD